MLNQKKITNILLDNPLLSWVLPLAVFVGFQLSLGMIFLYVPDEKVMGAVQRIFYFHVGSATACYLMLALLFIGSIAFLVSREGIWDALARSSASVGFLLASIVLATGMIWGHSAWNTWWRWEPRLVSSLVLWLMLLAYLVYRKFANDFVNEKSTSAVLGILSAIQVPIVIFSVKMIDQSEQLHPQVTANQGLADPRFVQALMVSILALSLFSVWLCFIRVNQILLAWRIEELEANS